MIASPEETASPSDFSQETIFPSFIVEDNAGMSMRVNSQSGTAAAAVAGVAAVAAPADGGVATPLDDDI